MIMLTWMLHLLGISSRRPDICHPLPYPVSPEEAFVKTLGSCIPCSNSSHSCVSFHAGLPIGAHPIQGLLATMLTRHPHMNRVPFLSSGMYILRLVNDCARFCSCDCPTRACSQHSESKRIKLNQGRSSHQSQHDGMNPTETIS